jgi:hypothetical protein
MRVNMRGVCALLSHAQVGNIYVLLRPKRLKKGQTAAPSVHERLQEEILDSQVSSGGRETWAPGEPAAMLIMIHVREIRA